MITTLAIKNYALIEDIRVDLRKGLTIITGETGAGKSILLGALALILGRRADIGSVKVASQKCIIECEFLIKNYNTLVRSDPVVYQSVRLRAAIGAPYFLACHLLSEN